MKKEGLRLLIGSRSKRGLNFLPLFTFGGAVHQPNKIYSIDRETGVAQFVANQSVTLEPVFAAFSVARVRHHTRR